MSIIDFVIIGVICIICGIILWKLISNKKNGKSGHCDGNCTGCPGYCHKKIKNK